jgi:hypothetical protein
MNITPLGSTPVMVNEGVGVEEEPFPAREPDSEKDVISDCQLSPL